MSLTSNDRTTAVVGISMDYTEGGVSRQTIDAAPGQVDDRTVVVTGGWLKMAAVKDEDWLEGESVPAPNQFIATIRRHKNFEADIFTFGQKPNDPSPRFSFHREWDSVAAIRIRSFSDWWNNCVSSDLRRDVRRAEKRGVTVRAVSFTDEFVRAIMQIYDETPIRQGRPFWHYKKPFDVVKVENATYLQRSEFVGAFCEDELIGFIKIVYVENMARLMQIIAKDAHRDKRPMNALIAKAVEISGEKGCSYLTYGKYRYQQGADSVTAFKHRNGFEEILVPRYYIPLTIVGKVALRLKLHHGAKALVPQPVRKSLRSLRAMIYREIQVLKERG